MKASDTAEGAPMSKRRLSAQQGIEAACILFQINSRSGAIDAMAQGARMPPEYASGPGAEIFRAEWRAFVHAVVTAGLMQHAPNTVFMGYLRQTVHLLAASASSAAFADPQAAESALTSFVDGPFAQYMPLLAREQQAACPDLFCRRLAERSPSGAVPSNQAKARLAAIMALVISAIWDKLEEYEILAD